MNINIPRLAVFFVCVIGLFWFIPNFYAKAFRTDKFQLGGSFSEISKEFVTWEVGPDRLIYENENGEKLDRVSAQKMLPFLFYNSIDKWKAFPLQSVDGENITYDTAKSGIQMLRLSARNILSNALPLHVLFESQPLGASLEIPDDMLLIKPNRFVFINCANGKVDEEKSKSFTEEAKNAGVIFPVLKAFANPSDLKPFDEGLFFADSANKIFQLKMVKGAPFVKKISETLDKKVLHVSVDESEKRVFDGTIVTENSIYINTYKDGLKKLPIENYNPKTTSATAYFSPMYETVLLNNLSVKNSPMQYMAMKDLNVIREYQKNIPRDIVQKREYVSYGLSFLTPFYLAQFNALSNEVLFEIKFAPNLTFALLGILFALALYIAINYKKRFYIADLAVICLTGIPGFITLQIFSSIAKKE
ncbi:MAG: DUF4857 domain-containing protein [Campylobacteraceae bacterium]|jgi:hypothetical protein|nr:DUF4857 domain-containing protein [Campylobacteraceae bacterium]